MADLQDSPTQPKPKRNWTDLSMEVRLLIAFLLMGLVLFLTPYIYKTPPAPAPMPQKASTQAPIPTQPTAQTAAPTSSAPVEPVAETGADKETPFVIDTDLYRIRFSNRGAVVASWQLKKHLDHAGKPLELVNVTAGGKAGQPFSIVFRGKTKPAFDPDQVFFAPTPTAGGLGIDYQYSDGKSVVRKSFQFKKSSYLSKVASEVMVGGVPAPHLLAWRGGFGDAYGLNAQTTGHALFYDAPAAKLNTKVAKDAKDGVIKFTGNYTFAGLEDMFFAAVFLPANDATMELDGYSDTVKTPIEGKDEPRVGAAVGGEGVNQFALFVGPKDVDLLATIDPKLKQLIDWGWFKYIAQPLFLALNWTNDKVVHNYGWAIILVTIAINICLLPLRLSSMKSAKKMQALQPQIAAINARFKNVGLRDPKKAEQNQEVMDLYKKHGANPIGGCLPMLFQLPLIYAFYRVLTVTIEMRGAHWLWVMDLSQPESLAIRVLPTIMIVTQFLVQKMTPNPTVDPAQQKMMMLMPLAFGFFFYSQPSGLVLYWLTGNLVGIVQQYAINRSMPAAPVPVAPKQIAKGKGTKK